MLLSKLFSSEKTSAPIERSDAGVQTEILVKTEQHCQTEQRIGKDFQCQANIQFENESISTQTDGIEKRDFEVQANLQQQTESKVVQTIKEEITAQNIRMPNIPNSVGQTKSKKRKLSSISGHSSSSTQNATTDSVSPATQTLNENTNSEVESTIDPDILNSEVYKIYCRCKDPQEAMEKIKEMGNCCWFVEPRWPLPPEEVLRRGFDDALRKLWSLGSSKWEQVKWYLEKDYGSGYYFMGPEGPKVKWNSNDKTNDCSVSSILEHRFTKIKILLPYGYEFWYIKNFEGGVGASKWYRGVSFTALKSGELDDWKGYYSDRRAPKMAKLHAMGLTNSMIKKYRNEYYVAKNSITTPWLDFAKTLLKNDQYYLLPDALRRRCDEVEFDHSKVKNETTIEFIASLELPYFDNDEKKYIPFKTYKGKSTRPLKKTRLPKSEKEEMKKEAEKAALIECFKDRWGFTEFTDITVDELHRPITA